MKISEYSNLEEAFEKSMVKDEDHILIRHSYRKGVHITPHTHNDADEYVIASEGHFKIFSDEIVREFQLDGKSTFVIFYPAGREHGLMVLSDKLYYFVLRYKI